MALLRLAKIVMVAGLAAYALLVAFGNITDYESNFAFIEHVMSMDTTFPGNRLMYRAITSPLLHNLAYCAIIAGEALTGIVLAIPLGACGRRAAMPGASRRRRECWPWAPHWPSLSGLSGFWWLPASGSPCGNQRRGTDRNPPFALLPASCWSPSS
jgi:hypothetical protein